MSAAAAGSLYARAREAAVEPTGIRRMAEAMHGVEAACDVRSRGRRGARFAELAIVVPTAINLEAAHDIADVVEEEVRRRLGARRVIVHMEPRSAAPEAALNAGAGA